MNRRRAIATLAALGASAALRGAHAQQRAGMPRVAVFMYGSTANFRSRGDAFTDAMRNLGYHEGRNVRYDWRSANGQEELLRTVAEDFARERFDVVVSANTNTSRALHKATKTVPIVMGAVEDPVAEGFVNSLARPGSNMTGVSASVLEQLPRQIELLSEVAPHLTQLTALVNPENPAYREYRVHLEGAARQRGIRLAITGARSSQELEGAFAADSRNAGMVVMNDPMFYTERAYIAELAANARRPAVYAVRGHVEAGGLMSYGPNLDANFARAAAYVDRILRGAKPAELPIEPAPRLELVFHRGATQALELTIPTELLNQATVIIS